MRALLLAGTSLLALAVTMPGAEAAPILQDSTPGLTSFTVPTNAPFTATYLIQAIGASGGTEPYPNLGNASGGNGADVTSHFSLTPARF